MHTEILNWTQAPDASPWFATIDRTTGEFAHWPGILRTALPQPDNHDLYFTPLWFRGERKNENAARLNILFADLDRSTTLPYEPTILWATSQGSTQAVWFLSEDLPPHKWASLNRGMTRVTNADRGGWPQAKLLRVPGTWNYKREPAELGRVLTHDLSVVYDPLDLADLMMMSTIRDESELDQNLLDFDWNQFLESKRGDIGEYAYHLLKRPRQRVRDRSLEIVRVINHLRRLYVSNEDMFRLIWGADWNKWRTDRNASDYLWSLIITDQH